MNANLNQYQRNQILTASPEQILLMLYDGAIKFCRQAIIATQGDKLPEKLEGIRRTLAIVTEFSDSLNHEIGGQIAADLDALYQFMVRELHAARKDINCEHLNNVETLLVNLRGTWAEAIEICKNEQVLQVKKHPAGEEASGDFANRLFAAG